MSNLQNTSMVDAVAFAKAIADDTRQRIMRICCCERLTVGDIADKIGVSQPTVSHHLAILRDAGLVIVDKRGRESFYSLNQERITLCCDRLMALFAPTQALVAADAVATRVATS